VQTNRDSDPLFYDNYLQRSRLFPSLIASAQGVPAVRRQILMAPRHSRTARRKHRIVSISMAPDDAAWVDTLVDLLVDGGYSKAGRSEVVRLALLELRVVLRERGRSEVVRYFVQRDAERQVASLLDRVEEAVPANDDKEPGDAT
jgi:hypothetical protein